MGAAFTSPRLPHRGGRFPLVVAGGARHGRRADNVQQGLQHAALQLRGGVGMEGVSRWDDATQPGTYIGLDVAVAHKGKARVEARRHQVGKAQTVNVAGDLVDNLEGAGVNAAAEQ